MHKLFKYWLLLFISMLPMAVSAKDNTTVKPLEVGVIPYMSARVLITSYEPMRQYLEKTLGTPVHVYTANGFKQFFMNSQKGDYDLVISASHFARILQKDNNFTPLVRYSKGGRGLVMTAAKGSIKNSHDLIGQTIALPDQLSLASIVCMTSLQEMGLKAGTDFKLLEVPSFESAILAIQKGNATAAVSAPGALVQMNKELRESVHPVIDTGEYINLVFLANPKLNKQLADKIGNTLLNFENKTNEGKQFFASTGFGGFIPVTQHDMNSLDRYTAETKRLLAQTN